MRADLSTSNRNIDDLHPCLARACREFLRRCEEQGLNVLITETYRSDERQDWLFEQGRSRPGNIVTNVRGGSGNHNYDAAFDFARNVRGREWDNSDRFFNKCGAIWEMARFKPSLQRAGAYEAYIEPPGLLKDEAGERSRL
jgi:peptidoglycan L-alanyl-D-glutamate endopeptidase CwlK